MTTLYAIASDFTYDYNTLPGQYKAGQAPAGYFFFNPLAELERVLGPEDPVFQYWCKQCAGFWTPSWEGPDSLNCGGATPTYQCFDWFQMEGQGSCDWAISWIYSIFWSRVCEKPEGPCTTL